MPKKVKKPNAAYLDKILSGWDSVRKMIMDLSEADLLALLHRERERDNRRSYKVLIYGRYNKVRVAREWKEVFEDR